MLNRTKIFTFDRWDFLATRGLLVMISIVVPIVSLGAPLVEWISGEDLKWTGPTGYGTSLRSAPLISAHSSTTTWADQLTVSIPNASVGTRLARLLPGLVASIATLTVCWLLLRLMKSIQQQTSFSNVTVWSLRLIALVILIGSVAYFVTQAIANSAVMGHAMGRPKLRTSQSRWLDL